MVSTAKRAVRYLIGSKHFGLKYYRKWRSDRVLSISSNWGPTDPVKCYTDADWARQVDDSKSTEAMVLLFNGTIIAWHSKTLKIVALSSQDAEYMALSGGSREIIFVRQLLSTLGNVSVQTWVHALLSACTLNIQWLESICALHMETFVRGVLNYSWEFLSYPWLLVLFRGFLGLKIRQATQYLVS